ncbi:Replication factor c subunit [Thalictrum thalictroides]|uniref:Replication factor c subunit n=1 Tax=Thalictrum thalictroides TaxID=46969 RepID=A0A7J6X9R4_THATH|nr:Replication factor c subunit [Thalictrum thalictroides]
MLGMENSSRYGRNSYSNPQNQRRSGYEPSDTENDWQESPWHDLKSNMRPRDEAMFTDRPRTPMKNVSPLRRPRDGAITADRPRTPTKNVSPISRSKRFSSNHDYDTVSNVTASRTSPVRRRNSKSPYKPRRDHSHDYVVSPILDGLETRTNVSPFSKPERRRHISPYKTRGEEPELDAEDYVNVNKKQNHRVPNMYGDAGKVGAYTPSEEASRVSERSMYSRRSKSTPRPRAKENEQQTDLGMDQVGHYKNPAPLSRNLSRTQRETYHIKAPSASELNEIVAKAKLTQGPNDALNTDTDSISPGDIFFSREYAAFATEKSVPSRKNGFGGSFPARPNPVPERETASHRKNRVSATSLPKIRVVSSSTSASLTNTNSTFTISRNNSSKSSLESSKFSDGSVRSSQSLSKFTENRQKVQKDTWFSCGKKGSCRMSISPEARPIDEASFIGKAFVVESLKPFWTEKHQPTSLNGFTCHKHQALLLKQLISNNSCPHILFKGPPGSGKKALTMAFLHEVFGDSVLNISHELRRFNSQDGRAQVVVPITSSPNHLELNLKSEARNARYALMSLVKEIAGNTSAPEVSTASFRADYKVIVLNDICKAPENVQHLIKWIIDCYSDSCKIILSCEDDGNILDSIKNRCEVVNVDAPVTHEIMEILIQIAKKENIDLPMSFAAKIATKSKQNLRKAIMALEACKAHNYPFVDEQPISLGWEEVLVEVAAEILADPSRQRLIVVRAKFQKLLIDFIHPKLILQKLVEQFLKRVEASLKRELYYWYYYYEKRLPTGTSSILKLEGRILVNLL